MLRFLDIPQAAAMAADHAKSRLVIYSGDEPGWSYVKNTAAALKWDEKKFQIRAAMREGENP